MDASMYKTKYKSWLKRASCRVVRPISKILVASVLLTSVPVLGGSTATGVDGRVKEQSGYREEGQDEGEQRYKNYYVSYFKGVVPLGSESLKKKVSITNQDIQAWKKKKGYGKNANHIELRNGSCGNCYGKGSKRFRNFLSDSGSVT